MRSMPTTRPVTALGGVVLLAGLVAGCGGQSGAVQEPTSTSETPGTVAAGPGAQAPTLESLPPGSTRATTSSGGSGGSAHDLMPNLRGETLTEANHVLGDNVAITWRDESSRNRVILDPNHWQVCRQSPAPGASYRGVHVKLAAVKTSERC